MWDVMNAKSLGTLKLHKSCVQNFLFSPPAATGSYNHKSPPPIILVSVADQIGWWNVSQLSMGSHGQRRRINSGQQRRKQNGDSPKLATGYLADGWIGKEGQKGGTELLGCVKLVGREATKVSASSDFAVFATVDTSGVVYIMKILQ
jgi:hypothetical protein